MSAEARIPQELFDEIIAISISDSALDRRTLASYSLVSQDWLLTTRKYMFRHIKVSRSAEKTSRLVELLNSSCERISSFISSVDLEVYPGYRDICQPLVDILAAKSVSPARLSVFFSHETEGLDFGTLDLDIFLLPWAEQVTSLRLGGRDIRADDTDESAVGRFVSRFTKLLSLEINLSGPSTTFTLLEPYTLPSTLTSLKLDEASTIDVQLIPWILAQDTLRLTSLDVVNDAEHVRLISKYSRVLEHLSMHVSGDFGPQDLNYPGFPNLTSLVLRFYFSELPLALSVLQSLDLPALSSLVFRVISSVFKTEAFRNWVLFKPIIESLPLLNKVNFHLSRLEDRRVFAYQKNMLGKYFQSSPRREILLISYNEWVPVSVF